MKKNFLSQLAEKFPWAGMENEILLTPFKDAAWDETFLPSLNNVLQRYKEDNPLRCTQVLDFVGRGLNCRSKSETTLSHYKNPEVARMALPCYRSLLSKDYSFRVYELLVLQNIAFEHSELKDEAIAILAEAAGREYILCGAKDKSYLEEYSFLYKGTKLEDAFNKKLVVL